MYFKLGLLLLLFSFSAKAQEDIMIKELIENIAENLPDDFDLYELTERLVYFKKHPINLNHTNAEELKSLYFLSALQIGNFFSHLASNGKFIDVLELQAVVGFDLVTVQRLLPYVSINESDLKEKISLKKLMLLSENDVVIRYARGIETQKGFKTVTGARYLGSPEKVLIRYKYNFSNRISAALVMEKDAGEKLVAKPFDFVSAHFAINDVGPFKKIIVGDYSLQFGEGLTLWSGFGFGKGPDVTSVAKKDVGLKPYSSANEYSFFRGLATKISLSKNIDFNGFLSYRNHDASLNEDEALSTINETGYHRTLTEITNHNSIDQLVYGAIGQYHKNALNLGMIIYQSHYNKAFITGPTTYRLYNFTGKNLSNLGVHYNYTHQNIYFFGELAKSLGGGIAYTNGVLMSLSQQISTVLLHRNYQRDYHSFFNQAPGEAEGFNESGFYVGLNIIPSRKWLISLYADYFRFPWLKYRVDAPSKGYEILGQLNFAPSKTFKAILRYKSELKQQNTDLEVPINYLDEVKKESYRMDVNWQLNSRLLFQNRLEVSQFNKEFGYLYYQDFEFAPFKAKLTGNLRLAYFNTTSYNSRLYAYEDDVLYNFSFGMYSGKGFRSYVNLKYKLAKKLDVWLRYAIFYNQNVVTVGSGLDEINGNKKSDVKVQVRYQF